MILKPVVSCDSVGFECLELEVTHEPLRATFSTKDWVLHIDSDTVRLSFPQTLFKKFLDEELTDKGLLRTPSTHLRDWAERNKEKDAAENSA